MPARLPPVVRKYWYSIDWDVEALWKLDLPIITLPRAELEWHFDVALWPSNEGPYSLTPAQVLLSPKRYSEEYARMRRADLGYPLDIIRRDERWMILDGVHRLLKAHQEDQATIAVRIVPHDAVRWMDLPDR